MSPEFIPEAKMLVGAGLSLAIAAFSVLTLADAARTMIRDLRSAPTTRAPAEKR